MDPFSIAGRRIDREQPPYVVAEAGVNHNGDPQLALRLVDAAAKAGADAVKFQTFDVESLVLADAPAAEYQRERAGAGSQAEMLRTLVLSPAALQDAFARARDLGIAAFSTPFDSDSLRLIVELGVPAVKIGSGDLTDLMLLREAARCGRPMIISTGMATIAEVANAVDAIRTAQGVPLALLHCLSAYPAPSAETNLRAIRTLREQFGMEVGFSDHTTGSTAAIAAVALGASIIEKHLTLDRSMQGPDHAASSEPSEFATLVQAVREAHAALGSGEKVPQPSEQEIRRVARRSLVFARDISAGTVLNASDLAAKRPGYGVSPMRIDDIAGRRLTRDRPRDTLLELGDLDPPLEVDDPSGS